MYCEHYSTLPYLCKAIDGTTQLRKNQNRPESPSCEPAAEYLRTACGIIAAEPLNSKSNCTLAAKLLKLNQIAHTCGKTVGVKSNCARLHRHRRTHLPCACVRIAEHQIKLRALAAKLLSVNLNCQVLAPQPPNSKSASAYLRQSS